MKIIRFVLPFLFIRNWYDGSWELSRLRLLFLTGLLFLIGTAVVIAYILQAPVTYSSV